MQTGDKRIKKLENRVEKLEKLVQAMDAAINNSNALLMEHSAALGFVLGVIEDAKAQYIEKNGLTEDGKPSNIIVPGK